MYRRVRERDKGESHKVGERERERDRERYFQLHKVFLSYIKVELEKWNMSTNNSSSKEKLPHSREKKSRKR